MIFWNVGQGDFITYSDPQNCWLIDVGGSSYIKPKENLLFKKICRSKRSLLFITHFDLDHIRFYKKVARNLKISQVYVSHLTELRTRTAKRLVDFFRTEGIRIELMKKGDSIVSKWGKLKCLWPGTIENLHSENDRSLVLYFDGPVKFLFTGDLPGRQESHLGVFAKTDVLKISHHGSRSSSTAKFLSRARPRTCVISAGTNNSYGHPHAQTLNRLKSVGCSVLRTDILGTLILSL